MRELRAAPLPVATGEFQAMMHVELVNDGPVTILIDSKTTSSDVRPMLAVSPVTPSGAIPRKR